MSITKPNNVKVFGSCERTMVLTHGFGCDRSMSRFPEPMGL